MRTENKEREKTWQNKAVSRSKAIKSLKKEVCRQKARVSKWRMKSQSLEMQLVELQALSGSKAVIEQELGVINEPKAGESRSQDLRKKGYKYPFCFIIRIPFHVIFCKYIY